MDTVVTGRTAGSPVRVLKNRLSREYMKLEQQEESQAEREKSSQSEHSAEPLRKAICRTVQL